MSKTAQLLQELIAVPSVNPGLASPDDPRAGERRLGEFIAGIATRARLDVEFRNVAPDRANVLAALRPGGKTRQRVLLAPHLDTVGGGEHSFCPRAQNGRIYGRGACDTKGSIAAMLSALIQVAGTPNRPRHTEIVFVGLVDEEYLQAGSRALAQSGYAADLAIVGEPTRLKVVTAHKGAVWLRIETRGKAAHGARPDLGRNAVYEMAKVVEVLHREYPQKHLRRRHSLLGPPTISVGSIKGGHQPNIVPAECVITVDRRTVPGETEGRVMAQLQASLRRHGLRAEVRKLHSVPCPALETDARLPLVRRFMAAARQRQPSGVVFFSDAAVLASGGIPSVLFGPGDIAQAHTADEWVEVSQLERAKDILTRFLQSLD